MTALSISEVSKRYDAVTVLKQLSLTVQSGEFIALVGPSGCGKSTLLRIIAGLETQSSGSVALDNKPIDGLRASERNLAMVFQSYALYPHLTVAQNIATPLQLRDLSRLQQLPIIGRWMPGGRSRRKEIDQQVRQAAKLLDIEHLLDRKPGQLSGGQRQRVALGRALVRKPAAFLLDEPLSNLDAKLRVQMRAEIAQLHQKLQTTFIYVTHDQVEAMTMADRIAVIMDGELLQCASPEEIYRYPADIRVAEFIGSPPANLIPAALIDPVLVESGVAIVGVRPENLRIVDNGGAALPGLVGQLDYQENLGAEQLLYIAVDGVDKRLVVKLDNQWQTPLEQGMEIALEPDWNQLMYFAADGKAMEIDQTSAEVVNA